MAGTDVSLLEQMNQLLADKERVIDEKRAALQKEMDELRNFEQELILKTSELKAAQDALVKEREDISAQWEKVKDYERTVEKSMSMVLEEKLKQETRSKEQLEQELSVSSSETSQVEKIDLNALRASIGIPVQETTPVVSAAKAKEEPVAEVIPEMIANIQTEATKTWREPKNYVLEVTPQLLCMKIGTKELRVFAKNDKPSEVHIVLNYRNAESDAKLKRKIVLMEREIPDWELVPTANQLVAKMLFTNDTDAKVIISKVKECIKKIDE